MLRSPEHGILNRRVIDLFESCFIACQQNKTGSNFNQRGDVTNHHFCELNFTEVAEVELFWINLSLYS